MSKSEIVFTGFSKREYLKMLQDGVQHAKCMNCGRTTEDESVVVIDGRTVSKEMEFFIHEVVISDEETAKYFLCIECSILKEASESFKESELS